MAYQNVGTPRFYVNVLEYLSSVGYIQIDDKHRTHPTTMYPEESEIITIVPENIFIEKSFVAYLGHTGGKLHFVTAFGDDISVNASKGTTGQLLPEWDGFSIASFNGFDIAPNQGNTISTWHEFPLSSIVVGNYYDMPHSPDLSLTMTREYGGIKTIETKGGASLSNAFYSKPPAWGDLGAWEIGGGDPKLSKSGRRVWDLSFSYLQDSSLFPDVSALRNYGVEGYSEGDSATLNTLLNGDDFYGQVIHKTNGGQLPFIFQPDKDNDNPDQFAICKFDSGFKFDQVANGVYNVKLKIREVW